MCIRLRGWYTLATRKTADYNCLEISHVLTAMVIGKLEVTLYLLSKPNSLKAKRMVVKSLKDRLQRMFRVSVAEDNEGSSLHHAVLGVAVIANSRQQVNSIISKILNFIDKQQDIYIVNSYTEYY